MFTNFNREQFSQSLTGLREFTNAYVWRPLFGTPQHTTDNSPLPISAPSTYTAPDNEHVEVPTYPRDDGPSHNDRETEDIEMEDSEGSFYTAQDSRTSSEALSSDSFHTAESRFEEDRIAAMTTSAAVRYRPCEYDALEAFGDTNGEEGQEGADPMDRHFAPDHTLRRAVEHSIQRLSELSHLMYRGPHGDTSSMQGRASDQSDSPQTPPRRVLYGAYTWPPLAGLDIVHEYIRNPAALSERVADEVFPHIPESSFERQSPTHEEVQDYIQRSGRGVDPQSTTEDTGLPPRVMARFYSGLVSAETPSHVNEGAQHGFEAPADLRMDIDIAEDANAGFMVEHQDEPASNNGEDIQGSSEPPYAIMTNNPLFDPTRPTTIGRRRVSETREAETVAEGSSDRRKRVRVQDNAQLESSDSAPVPTVVTPLRRSRRRARKTSCKECIGCSYSRKRQ